jgi:uncharacterized DUF497 family protein
MMNRVQRIALRDPAARAWLLTPGTNRSLTSSLEWYNSHIRCVLVSMVEKAQAWDRFEEARELFSQPYWLDRRSDVPEQFLAVGWVGGRLYSVIFEVREDDDSEILHLITLWRSTKEEIRLYEENS